MAFQEVANPTERSYYETSGLTKEEKQKLLEADPNGGRCIVTNAKYPLNYCHCIAKVHTKNKTLLDSLEWVWNMRRNSLNLNSYKNIFLTKNDFDTSFDQENWLLMPKEETIKKFFASLESIGDEFKSKREAFPSDSDLEDGHSIFTYKLVALPCMKDKDILIYRQYDDIEGDGENASNVSTVYRYPYGTFPSLKSHLHPKFAIFDAGKKLKALLQKTKNLQDLQRLYDKYPVLKNIQRLYDAWTQKVPTYALDDLSYVDESKIKYSSESDDPGERDDINYIGRSTRGRGDEQYSRPRTRSVATTELGDNIRDNQTAHQREGGGITRPSTRDMVADNFEDDSNRVRPSQARGRKESQDDERRSRKRTPASKKRKVLSESSSPDRHLLSEMTLSRFNKYVGEATWTTESIHCWSTSKTSTMKRKFIRV